MKEQVLTSVQIPKFDLTILVSRDKDGHRWMDNDWINSSSGRTCRLIINNNTITIGFIDLFKGDKWCWWIVDGRWGRFQWIKVININRSIGERYCNHGCSDRCRGQSYGWCTCGIVVTCNVIDACQTRWSLVRVWRLDLLINHCNQQG